MKERIHWIDWGKALAVICVVFCHLPQSQEWFYYRYLQSVIIVIFFFLSGYLKKDRGSWKGNWQKYWRGLVIPYLLYCLIVYPYWLCRFYMQHNALPNAFEALKPIIGTLLLQHENAYAEPLNGPLWYLPAILIMHLIIDLCRRTKYQHTIMMLLCIISFVLYTANKYWYFSPQLTPMGLMRNLPYYYIGYLCAQKQWFSSTVFKRNLIGCIGCLCISIILFDWHLRAFFNGEHILHIILFYPVNICFMFGVLYGCKLLRHPAPAWVETLSIGTLVIIGLHIVMVSAVNIMIEHLMGLDNTICYQWYEALPLALLIVGILYPFILWAKKHAPLFLGK